MALTRVNDNYTSIESNEVDDLYRGAVESIWYCGELVNGTKELNNVTLHLTDISDPIIRIRNISKKYCAAELLWYLNGRNDVEFIGKYASMWKRLTDDGKTSNSAYGYILNSKHGFNQIDKMVELLKFDPNSRRAVMNINVPNEHVIETKDEMCTLSIQYLLRDNKLHCTVMMRSNDIYFGFPFDIISFVTWQKMIADRLGVEYGTYTHFATSLHMYERDFEKFEGMMASFFTKDDDTFYLNHKNLMDNYKVALERVENGEDIVDVFNNLNIFTYNN